MSDKISTRKIVSAMSATVLLAAGLQSSPAEACGGTQSYIGTMCVFAGNFSPRNYALANGQLLAISQNQSLFAILGTTYGGDGRTNFALPDTRGRSLIGAGNGPGLSNYNLGQRGGVETVTLNVNQLPAHNHGATTTVTATATANGNSAGNQTNPDGNVWAQKGRTNIYSDQTPDVTMSASAIDVTATATTAVANSGSGQSHENRSPYLAVNWIIALQGLFPPRN